VVKDDVITLGGGGPRYPIVSNSNMYVIIMQYNTISIVMHLENKIICVYSLQKSLLFMIDFFNVASNS
jgi:hypothetical protein